MYTAMVALSMAKIGAESVCTWTVGSNAPFIPKWRVSRSFKLHSRALSSTIRASQSMDDKNKVFKELGMFSLRKKIEDAVFRAETLAPTALELEEARHIKQEQMIHQYNLWDDLSKSNEILVNLADSSEVVDALKDLRYKAEEAKLITELAGMDAINYGLFKQAYIASLDVSKFMDKYELSKLLRGPYDVEGACMIITAGNSGFYPEIWAEQVLQMYMKWAENQGLGARIVEKCLSKNGGIKCATVELESKYAYGYLSGERGVHCMISNSHNASVLHEKSATKVRSVPTMKERGDINLFGVGGGLLDTLKSGKPEANIAAVDVIPLFLETAPDLLIEDEDLLFSLPSSCEAECRETGFAVCIQHIATGLKAESSGERNPFANKIKALNRLKAKLLIILRDQGIPNVKSIKKDSMVDLWHQQARRYIFHPHKLVQDVKTGFQMSDLNSVLDGNIEPLIAANVNSRQA